MKTTLGAAPADQISFCGMRIQENASSSKLRAQVILFRKIKRSSSASFFTLILSNFRKRYSSGSTSFSGLEWQWSCVQFTSRAKKMSTRRGRRGSQREAQRSGEGKPRTVSNPTPKKRRCNACANLRMTLMLYPLYRSLRAWTSKTKELLLDILLAHDPLHTHQHRVICLQLLLSNHQLPYVHPRSARLSPKSLSPPLAPGRRSSSCTVPKFEISICHDFLLSFFCPIFIVSFLSTISISQWQSSTLSLKSRTDDGLQLEM